MRRRIVIAASAAILAVAGVAADLTRSAAAHPPPVLSPAQEQATADEIRAFRKDLAAAITAKDVARLRRMFAEGFTHVEGPDRTDDRDARIAAAVAGDPLIETAPADDLAIRTPGGWTGIATGTSRLRSIANGKTYRVSWMAVYVRGPDGGWQIAASHASRVGEGPR